MKKRLILVDGSSYFFRAFHALPPLTNSKGLPTGAVYGVANMIKRLIKDHRCDYIAVVFDAKGGSFRNQLYPAYKAHRPSMPEELICQFKPLMQLLENMGLPLLIVEGVEADDVIGTLTLQATHAGYDVLISTGDKDIAQLVNPQVTLINTMTDQMLDEAKVFEKFQVTPAQIIDYLTLIGDSSDNIPGVPKCGPKTAVKWLQQYHDLDTLVAHAQEISGAIGDRLRESLKDLPLFKQLITIKTDVELPIQLNDLIPRFPNIEVLKKLITELEFKPTWLASIPNLTSSMVTTNEQENFREESTKEKSDVSGITSIEKVISESGDHIESKIAESQTLFENVEIITTWDAFETWLPQLQQASTYCVDTETTNLSAISAELVGLAFAIHPDRGIYIPFIHDEQTIQLSRKKVLEALKPMLENPSKKIIGQNIKYDYLVLQNHGITLKGQFYDTLLESYVLNSTNRHNLDSQALTHLGYTTIQFTDIAGSGVKQKTFNQISIEQAAPYAVEYACITLQLHQYHYPQLQKPLDWVFHHIEMPLVPILAAMEQHGVMIDCEQLSNHGKRLRLRVAELEQEAHHLANKAFNLQSPKQLLTILYHDLNLPVLAKTPTGQPSTAEAVLQELAYDYRLPALIVEHRRLSKLISTYIDALPACINAQTQRVHTSYNQAVTTTGRLSSSEPNLQNIPVRGEEGRLIRRAFIAPQDYQLLSADYSQIELRIMAHLSQDAQLIRAFANQWDVHAATASEVFGVPLAEVSADQRRKAKAVNFGLIYGMSAFGLAKQIGVERHEAQHYIDRYFQRYPGVLAYMERMRRLAHQQGFVETLFGRRLYLPEINVRQIARQKAAERLAINAPMQGTAADIIKQAMIAIATWIDELPQSRQIHMIMQVHDELVFEVHQDFIDTAKEKIRHLMEHTVKLSVPLEVSLGMGKTWDEAH